ncbi:MAG: immunoglobulin domain-containing protein [Phycisphaerae bacterium]|nr:immunoglobulin domain-containing protein [Phycisphaerae bacterium]
MLKRSGRWSRLLAACVTGLAGLTGAASGQEGPLQPWVGEKGITETVAQIMARERSRAPWDGIIRFGDEGRAPDRSGLPQAGDSLGPVSQWPPADPNNQKNLGQGGAAGHHGGGMRNPQTLGTEFNGPTLSSSGFVPPDTQGAVGPTQVLMAANGRITVYSKAGAVGGLNVVIDTFFNSVRNGSGISDPQVRYDETSGRWFVVAVNTSTPNRVVLAVSSGSTITNSASFTFFFFQWDTVTPTNASDTNGFYDYPSLGVDANALYIGGNVFNASFNGCTAFVVRKSSMTSGGPIVVTPFRRIVASAGGAGPYSPRGVDNNDPAATEGYFVGPANNAFSRITIRRVTNPGGTPSISADLNVTVPTTVNPQTQNQLSGAATLDSLDDRLFAAQIRKNRQTGLVSMWAAHNIEVNASGAGSTTGSRNGSRWYEIQSLTGTPTLRQSGTLFDPAASNPLGYWIPSVAMSGQGHMALGASYAGATANPGCAVAGRLSADTLGATQAVTVAEVSASSYAAQGAGENRWGDYSSVWVDPTDDMTMWAFIEYCNTSNSWACRAIQLKAPAPAIPLSCSPSSVAQGASNVNVVVTGDVTGGRGFFDPDATHPNHIAASVGGTGVTVNSVTWTSASSITLNVSVSGAAATGARTVTVTNPDAQAATSAGGILTVTSGCTAPSITGQPSPQTKCQGQPASFSVTATGTGLTYQWRKNTVNIGGATSSTYSIASVVVGDAGSYDCVVTGTCGTATSNTASLTVNTAPSIGGNPVGGTVHVGDPFTFTVSATGTGLTYQWRKNTVNIGGATSTSYSIASATLADAGSYDCVVTGTCGAATSTAAALTVLCAADYNGDTSVDDFDYFDFLNDFNNNNLAADYNGDTSVDDFDLFDFLNDFNIPCP